MTNMKLTRRNALAAAIGTGVVSAAGVLAATPSAQAYQGNMERALNELFAAQESLRHATPNKGGHRERAIDLIVRAIGEVQAGIDFAAERGGG
jgi:hypothetical protein